MSTLPAAEKSPGQVAAESLLEQLQATFHSGPDHDLIDQAQLEELMGNMILMINQQRAQLEFLRSTLSTLVSKTHPEHIPAIRAMEEADNSLQSVWSRGLDPATQASL